MIDPDLQQLRHQLRTIAGLAEALRRHTADLHTLGWEPFAAGPDGGSSGQRTDWTPQAGDPRARHVLAHLAAIAARAEADLLGCWRHTNSILGPLHSPTPTRGSTISAAEHAQLIKNQTRRRNNGDYTPQRTMNQPPHPGRNR